MSLAQSMGLSKWHLGLGAVTGVIYYFNNASNRQHFQNYFYHTITNIFSELGHMNILILIGICIIGFTKTNYNMINVFSNITAIWSKPLINVIFLCLRVISAIKVIIAILRGLIKARKITKFETKVSNNLDILTLSSTIEKLNNKCIICFDELTSSDDNESQQKRTLLLNCGHLFHFNCFKLWYKTSENCPYCRTKVEL